MRANDNLDSFGRCLSAFYGSATIRKAGGLMEPRDLPRKLGREAEFWQYWDSWQAISAGRPEDQAKLKATVRNAAKSISELFTF